MSNDFPIPRFGPGSQSEPDGAALDYLEMPADMRTYAPHVPMIEVTDTVAPAMALMAEIAEAARRSAAGAPPAIFDLLPLDTQNRRLIAETMGEGEVAMKLRGLPALSVQESVFAGIWGVTGAGIDRIEIGHVPEAAHIRAFVPTVPRRDLPLRDGVVNAPALLAELEGKSEGFSGNLHVINLSLLPHTEEDLVWLDQRLGHGSTDILSRGYGNCRVRATTLPFVWRVQFFNAMDTLILDTFEVTAMPEVALAAAEDLAESGARLLDVLEAMR